MTEAELTVRSDGEEVVFGIPGGLDIRMSLDQAEEFEFKVEQAVTKATFHKEARLVSGERPWEIVEMYKCSYSRKKSAG